jgi:hypothetical protein
VKLAETLATMAGLVSGRVPPAEAARALGAPTAGLALYADLARAARRSLLEGMFPHCHHAIVERRGQAAWHAIVEGYFETHPELRFVRHANVAAFPSFLDRNAGAAWPWLAELADLEWNEWVTEIAPRAGEDDAPDTGPRRVTSTLRLKRYAHDLVSWLDGAGRAGAPAARPIHAAFWQDRDALSYRNALSDAQVAALHAIHAGRTPERHLVDELRGADLVLGAPQGAIVQPRTSRG